VLLLVIVNQTAAQSFFPSLVREMHFLNSSVLDQGPVSIPKSFRTQKVLAKSQTLWLQSCFIHIFLIWTEVFFIQEVSGVYTSRFLDTDELKMAFRARKFPGAFEKRAHKYQHKFKRLSRIFEEYFFVNLHTRDLGY